MEAYSSAVTQLDAILRPDVTTLTVASTSRMPPSAFFKIRINSEVMLVRSIDDATTITVDRQQNGTAQPADHAVGSAIMNRSRSRGAGRSVQRSR